jgi:hypothetical protein
MITNRLEKNYCHEIRKTGTIRSRCTTTKRIDMSENRIDMDSEENGVIRGTTVFSRDLNSVGIFADKTMKTMPGVPVRICDIPAIDALGQK